jgi:hypothetical protein
VSDELEPDCPCCAPSWSVTRQDSRWTHLKIKISTREIVWLADHGTRVTSVGLTADKSQLFIVSRSAGYDSAIARKIDASDPSNILWSATNTFTPVGVAPFEIAAFKVDDSDNLIVGTYHGQDLVHYVPNKILRVDGDNGAISTLASMAAVPPFIDENPLNSLAGDSDGNNYFARGNAGLSKYDETNTVVWQNSDTRLHSMVAVAVNSDGSRIVVGGQDDGNFSGGFRVVDQDGSFVFRKTFLPFLRAVAYQKNGNVIVGGDSDGAIERKNVLAYTPAGALAWSRSFSEGYSGFNVSGVNCFCVDSADNIYVGGNYAPRINPNGALIPCLRRINADGTAVTWEMDLGFGTVAPAIGVTIQSIVLDEENDFIYVGGEARC